MYPTLARDKYEKSVALLSRKTFRAFLRLGLYLSGEAAEKQERTFRRVTTRSRRIYLIIMYTRAVYLLT